MGFEHQFFYSTSRKVNIAKWASCTLFVGSISISISISHEVLAEGDGDWGVIMFQLWGFLVSFNKIVLSRSTNQNKSHIKYMD